MSLPSYFKFWQEYINSSLLWRDGISQKELSKCQYMALHGLSLEQDDIFKVKILAR